jgi:hypothetical protein
LISCHWRCEAPAVRTSASPKTCGWRRRSFAAVARHNESSVFGLVSASMSAQLMTRKSVSPSSSAISSASILATASRIS